MKIIDYNKKNKPSAIVELVIGDCDSGKSCYAVSMALKYMEKGYPVFSNLYIKGAYKIELDDLMQYKLPPYSVIVFDEAATYGLNSRGEGYKKSNKDNVIQFFTMYRHLKVERAFVISPSFQDVIPVVRSRANLVTVTKFSFMNKFGYGKYKTIGKSIDIVGGDGVGSEPKECYYWHSFSTRFHSRKNAFKSYDTYTMKSLEEKVYSVWGSSEVSEVTTSSTSVIDKYRNLLVKK